MLSFRSPSSAGFRPAAFFAAFVLLASPLAHPLGAGGALAQEAATPEKSRGPKESGAKESSAKETKELSVGQSAARERQKKCGQEWRGLSATDKAAQSPKWPQYYSKCVKRLKQIKA